MAGCYPRTMESAGPPKPGRAGEPPYAALAAGNAIAYFALSWAFDSVATAAGWDVRSAAGLGERLVVAGVFGVFMPLATPWIERVARPRRRPDAGPR